MQEPSVLDFVKTRLHDWRYKLLHPSGSPELDTQPAEVRSELSAENIDTVSLRQDTVVPELLTETVVQPVPAAVDTR